MGYADYLTQSASVRARAPRRGGYGDDSPTLAPAVLGPVPCLVRPLRAEALARQGRDASERWHRVYLDADYSLTNDHVIVVDGRSFEVRGQLDVNSMGAVYAADCIEMVT